MQSNHNDMDICGVEVAGINGNRIIANTTINLDWGSTGVQPDTRQTGQYNFTKTL